MNQIDPTAIREVRGIYTEDNLDSDKLPDLRDLVEARKLPYKLFKEIATRENWDGQRYKNVKTYREQYAKEREVAIQSQAIDAAKTVETAVKQNLEFLQNQLPLIRSMLEDCVTTMTTKEKLAYFRLLNSLQKDTITLLKQAYDSADKDTSVQPSFGNLQDIKEVTDAIEQIEKTATAGTEDRERAIAQFDK